MQRHFNPIDRPEAAAEEAGSHARNLAALERAFARAEVSKAEILKSPDMLSGEDLGRELGLSRTTVDNRRLEGKLLALEFGTKRGFRYPRWQRELLEESHTREQFEAVLERLRSVGAWSRYRFFTQSAPALGGKTPLEALRAGVTDDVIAAAETWARGEQGGA
jgi:biotin operon repressor